MYVIKHSAKRLYVSCRIGKFRRILALEDADQEGFEDEGLYYHQRKRGDPKSRAQQQLRELEGKERLEKSRVERRLKLTQAAGQGELQSRLGRDIDSTAKAVGTPWAAW